MRKANVPPVIKDSIHPFDLMKNLRPETKAKQLYFRCGGTGKPNGNDDKNIKKQFTKEEPAKIMKHCRNNILKNDYFESIFNKTNKIKM